jgi:hypothetical protein
MQLLQYRMPSLVAENAARNLRVLFPRTALAGLLLLIVSLTAPGCEEPACFTIEEGVYGWTGRIDGEGAGFIRERMNIACVAEERDGDQVPLAVVRSARDGFFELTLPPGEQILCEGSGDLISFYVNNAHGQCVTLDVQGPTRRSYVTDQDLGIWWPEYGPGIAQCK